MHNSGVLLWPCKRIGLAIRVMIIQLLPGLLGRLLDGLLG